MEYSLTKEEQNYVASLKAEMEQAEQNLNRVKLLLEGAVKILLATHGMPVPAELTADCSKLISGAADPSVDALHKAIPVGSPN